MRYGALCFMQPYDKFMQKICPNRHIAPQRTSGLRRSAHTTQPYWAAPHHGRQGRGRTHTRTNDHATSWQTRPTPRCGISARTTSWQAAHIVEQPIMPHHGKPGPRHIGKPDRTAHLRRTLFELLNKCRSLDTQKFRCLIFYAVGFVKGFVNKAVFNRIKKVLKIHALRRKHSHIRPIKRA